MASNPLTLKALLVAACSPLAARTSPQRADSQSFAYHALCQLAQPPGICLPRCPEIYPIFYKNPVNFRPAIALPAPSEPVSCN